MPFGTTATRSTCSCCSNISRSWSDVASSRSTLLAQRCSSRRVAIHCRRAYARRSTLLAASAVCRMRWNSTLCVSPTTGVPGGNGSRAKQGTRQKDGVEGLRRGDGRASSNQIRLQRRHEVAPASQGLPDLANAAAICARDKFESRNPTPELALEQLRIARRAGGQDGDVVEAGELIDDVVVATGGPQLGGNRRRVGDIQNSARLATHRNAGACVSRASADASRRHPFGFTCPLS